MINIDVLELSRQLDQVRLVLSASAKTGYQPDDTVFSQFRLLTRIYNKAVDNGFRYKPTVAVDDL